MVRPLFLFSLQLTGLGRLPQRTDQMAAKVTRKGLDRKQIIALDAMPLN